VAIDVGGTISYLDYFFNSCASYMRAFGNKGGTSAHVILKNVELDIGFCVFFSMVGLPLMDDFI
jgi:hypothetical protein